MTSVWKCVAEVAAFRRDAAVFLLVVQTDVSLARGSLQATESRTNEYRYMVRFFDDVQFDQPNRCVKYTRNGVCHRDDDGPAVQYDCFVCEWYRHGTLHRGHGPAVVGPGVRLWFRDGVLHRDGGPAYNDVNRVAWYRNGVLHRDGGPAEVARIHPIFNAGFGAGFGAMGNVGVTGPTGPTGPTGMMGAIGALGPTLVPNHHVGTNVSTINQEVEEGMVHKWYADGVLHRVGGPAVAYRDGRFEYYERGVLHRTDGPTVREENCDKWYYRGQLHRTDGPAVANKRGEEEWFLHGMRHRVGGPAKRDDSREEWYQYGQEHGARRPPYFAARFVRGIGRP